MPHPFSWGIIREYTIRTIIVSTQYIPVTLIIWKLHDFECNEEDETLNVYGNTSEKGNSVHSGYDKSTYSLSSNFTKH